MKFKLLSVLLVCLMATSVFAVKYTWTSTTGGEWNNTANWFASPYATTLYSDEYNIYHNTMPAAAVISQNAGAFPGRIRLSGGKPDDATPAKIDIMPGGSISIAEFRVGDGISASDGGKGLVTQTGGTVTMIASNSGTSYSRDLVVGRGMASGPATKGKYIISGGTLTYADTDMYGDPITYNTARLQVGVSRSGSTATHINVDGTFTVVGDGGTVLMKQLQVGGDGTNRGSVETGTMEFQIVAGAVSKVQLATSVQLDSLGANSVANLLVSLTSGTPGDAIVLIETIGATAVSGLFDTLNGGSAAEGAAVVLGGQTYLLTYLYDAATSTAGAGNDIALLIPEPATIALLSLGLFAVRRRK